MMLNIISKGLEAMPNKIPQDWDESTVIHLEEETFTITFKNGSVSFTEGDKPDAHSKIKLTSKWLCDALDGSTDFMKVWMELAEPPDKSIVQKGSGLKLLTLLDFLTATYKSDAEFKKMVDSCKGSLKSV